jgi:hypothetical protein
MARSCVTRLCLVVALCAACSPIDTAKKHNRSVIASGPPAFPEVGENWIASPKGKPARFPAFPLPPPPWSITCEIPRRFFGKARTLGDVARALEVTDAADIPNLVSDLKRGDERTRVEAVDEGFLHAVSITLPNFLPVASITTSSSTRLSVCAWTAPVRNATVSNAVAVLLRNARRKIRNGNYECTFCL